MLDDLFEPAAAAGSRGTLNERPVRSAKSPMTKKQSAPAVVVQSAVSALSNLPVEATPNAATAETPKRTQPSPLTSGSHQP